VEPAGKYGVKFVTKEPFAALDGPRLGGLLGLHRERGRRGQARRPPNKNAVGTGPLSCWRTGRSSSRWCSSATPNYWKKGRAARRPADPARHPPTRPTSWPRCARARSTTPFIEDNKNYNLLKGREVADRLPLLAARLRLSQHQRLPAARSRTCASRQAISWAVDRAPGHAGGDGGLRAPDGPGPRRPMKTVAATRRPVAEVLQAPTSRRPRSCWPRPAWRAAFSVKCSVIPTFPHHGLGRAGHRAAAQAHRPINMEIENVEYAVLDQALAGQGLRHDHEHDARLRPTPTWGFFPPACTPPRGQKLETRGSMPDLDALLEEGRRTMDQKKRKEIYDRVQNHDSRERAAPCGFFSAGPPSTSPRPA